VCPISLRMLQKIMLVWKLWNKAPHSALAVEAKTNQMTFVLTWKAPLMQIMASTWGIHPMKKCLQDQLWVFPLDKYKASEWMFMIMLDA
jgi:hypothetical protein